MTGPGTSSPVEPAAPALSRPCSRPDRGRPEASWLGRLMLAPGDPLGQSALIVVLVALDPILRFRPASFLLLVVLLGLGGWRIARAVLRPPTLLDTVLVTWTVAFAWIAVASEALSLVRLYGDPTAWLGAAGLLAIGGLWLRPAARPLPPPELRSLWTPLHPVGRVLLVAFVLQAATALILTFFAGINIWDSLAAYVPRSLLMLQEGTVAAGGPYVGYLQHLHQDVVALQFLFLRSEVLVDAFSCLVAVVVGLTLFAFSRCLLPPSLRHGFLPIATALLPLTMPLVLLHASTSNFDLFEGLWLLLTLYFLRRGYAATNVRWLAAAALATGLALATKPTFYFAVPGLAVLWLATLLRPLLHRRRSGPARQAGLRRAVRSLLLTAALVAVVGTPFLVRNVVVHGYLLGPAANVEGGTGPSARPYDRLRLLGFNGAALGLELLTPPLLLPPAVADGLDGWFATRMQALGVRLPTRP